MMDKDEFDKINKLENTHWWYVGTREICFSILKKYLPNNKLKILDIGCGTGGNMQALKQFGDVEGNDIEPYTIQVCREKGFNCYVADVRSNKLAENTYDLITVFDVINQVSENQLDTTIENIVCGLKPGGLLAIREPAIKFANGRHDLAVNIQKRFYANQMQQLLENHGLKVLHNTYINFLLFIPVLLRRKLALKMHPTPKSDIYELNPILNSLLLFVLRIEKFLLTYVNFPFGVSLFTVAQKK